jgi:hypothetical protein
MSETVKTEEIETDRCPQSKHSQWIERVKRTLKNHHRYIADNVS